ncbi:hypothetical protein FIBSPDRAFT_860488 [Athelia psychrophila]|uniref:Uncharacterized protein n=1 Tax=Athelia psychrophila TaxID=1759441 RepID=A0A166K554_9AGAM|nr:hypothetical protein FIBSPDRAFT_860488 [Fibularhizoctonia sp. CBS 109695]
MAPRACIKRRVGMIHVGCLWRANETTIEDVQACADLVEFIQPQFYDREIVQVASLAILKHILVSGDAARHLIAIVARCNPHRIALIVSNIVRLLAEHFTSPTRDIISDVISYRGSRGTVAVRIDDASFFGREKELLFEKVMNTGPALLNVLKFATHLACRGLAVRQAMMDAGALALVLLVYSNQDFQARTLLVYAKRRGYNSRGEVEAIPLDIINGEAATLASLVSVYGFRENWSGQAYRARRAACAQFLKVLFGAIGEQGKLGELGERYRWMRAMYQKIVATS